MVSAERFLSDVHNELVGDSKTSASMFQDIEIHFCDERIQYNKLLLSLVEPVIITAIAEINVEDIVIIYPETSVKILKDLSVKNFDHEADIQTLTVDIFQEEAESKGSEFKCVPCGSVYASKKKLQKHYYYKHYGKDTTHHHKDKLGGEEINKKEDRSSGAGEIFCSECGKLFKRKSCLKRHIVTVHSETQEIVNCFYCQFCHRQFGRKDNLLKHVSKNHPQELL